MAQVANIVAVSLRWDVGCGTGDGLGWVGTWVVAQVMRWAELSWAGMWVRVQVMEVLSRYARFMDADLQQRAVEYMGLVLHPDVAKRNVTSKPPWEKRGSLLLRRLMHRAVCAITIAK